MKGRIHHPDTVGGREKPQSAGAKAPSATMRSVDWERVGAYKKRSRKGVPRLKPHSRNPDCETDLHPYRRLARDWWARRLTVEYVEHFYGQSTDALTQHAVGMYRRMVEAAPSNRRK